MLQEAEALIDSGNEALKAGDLLAARAAFEAALEQEEAPEAMFGLGDALWWLGEVELAIRYRERAYAAFRRRPDPAAGGDRCDEIVSHLPREYRQPRRLARMGRPGRAPRRGLSGSRRSAGGRC